MTSSIQTDPSCIDVAMASFDESFRTLERAQALVDEAISDLYTRVPLSVVIPVYNERATLPKVIDAVMDLPIEKEIVVVDDASTDGTGQWLESQSEREHLKVIRRRTNHGKGSALRLGFRHAEGEIIVIQDADLEYNPRDLLSVIRPIQERLCEVAYGSRYLSNAQQDPCFWHRLGNRALTSFSNATTGLRLTDMETCYKAFRREVIRPIMLRQCRFGFEPEVTAKIARRGHRVLEVPIEYSSRSYEDGKKIGWKDGVNAIYCMLRYWRAD